MVLDDIAKELEQLGIDAQVTEVEFEGPNNNCYPVITFKDEHDENLWQLSSIYSDYFIFKKVLK